MFFGSILIVVIIFVVVLAEKSDRELYTLRKFQACKKQPDKMCSLMMAPTRKGGLRYSNHGKCCKMIDQVKAANSMGCNLEVGVDYNGVMISQSYKDSCLRSRERVQNIDSSGPQD
jgi:hypothetical protein